MASHSVDESEDNASLSNETKSTNKLLMDLKQEMSKCTSQLKKHQSELVKNRNENVELRNTLQDVVMFLKESYNVATLAPTKVLQIFCSCANYDYLYYVNDF